MGSLTTSDGYRLADRYGTSLRVGFRTSERLSLLFEGSVFVPTTGSVDERARLLALLVRYRGPQLGRIGTYVETGYMTRNIVERADPATRLSFGGGALVGGAGLTIPITRALDTRLGYQLNTGSVQRRETIGGMQDWRQDWLVTHRLQLGFSWRLPTGGR